MKKPQCWTIGGTAIATGCRRPHARSRLARWFSLRHDGHQGADDGGNRLPPRPCQPAVRLFRPRRIRRCLHRRHHIRMGAEAIAVVRRLPRDRKSSSAPAWAHGSPCGWLRNWKTTDRIAGLLLIAPAPDFTMDLMEPAFTRRTARQLERDGQIEEPSQYSDEPTIITRALIEDGHANRVMKPGMKLGVPVRILQGSTDPDVPPSHAEKLVSHLAQDDVTLTMVQGGDHRLSRDADIALAGTHDRRYAATRRVNAATAGFACRHRLPCYIADHAEILPHTAGAHSQLFDRRPYRPRQVHSRRPPHPDVRRAGAARDVRAGARHRWISSASAASPSRRRRFG